MFSFAFRFARYASVFKLSEKSCKKTENMKLILFITLAVLWQMSTASELPKVSCEKIENRGCSTVDKECFMQEAVIKSTGVTVLEPVNTAVKKIRSVYNKNIEYLPENLYLNFPELEHIDAAACSLKQLSKATFRNLSKFKQLNLDGNRIERIEGDTFEGLTTLKGIYMSYNRVKFIDVHALQAHTGLQRLDLFNNECISRDFRAIENLDKVLKEIGDACGQA